MSPPAEVWPAGDTKWQQRACGAGRREFGFGVVGNKDVVVGESCGDIVGGETAQKPEAEARSAATAAPTRMAAAGSAAAPAKAAAGLVQ